MSSDLPIPDGVLATLARSWRDRRVSAVDLVQRALERIEAATDLGAVVRTDPAGALAAASAIDRADRSSGTPLPLAGVPVLVKDNIDVRGLPTTHASLLCAEAPRATEDDATVARLRAAGAIVVGKTNLSEFAMEAIADNLLFGPTHSPWRPGASPGGSSGGSAAALAAGLVPVATGTDGGGSVRIPASMCGLLGLKPTSGVTGARPARLPLELSSNGPMATTVADLRLLVRLTLGPAPGDPSCVRGPDPAVAGRRLDSVLATVRVAGDRGVDPQVERVFVAAVEDFAHATGRPVRWLDPGVLGADADEVWETIYAAEDVVAVGTDLLREGRDRLDPRVRRWVDRGLSTGLEEYLRARARRTEHVLRLDELLAPSSVLLTPTVAVASYPAAGPSGADGELMPIDLFNTAALNLTGHPALSVPAGTVDGMPVGLQLVGPRGSDLWLLELARAWEAARPWPLTAPGYEPFVEPGD